MKTVIGIVGEKGSGKDTFANLLKECLPARKVAHLRFSDILGETLKLWNIPATRHNLQYLAIVMTNQYGQDALTRALAARIASHDADIVVIDGIRWDSDVPMLRAFEDNHLVYVTASLEIRFDRTKLRKEKAMEGETSFEKFKEEELVATELEILRIGKKADIIVKNEGTMADLKNKVSEFCDVFIKK